MKKFTSLLISCSLTLAGAALAQQPDDQASPKPNQAAEKGKGHGQEAKPVKPERQAPVAPKADKAAPQMEQAAPKMDKAPMAKPSHENKMAEPHGAKTAPDMTKAPKADMTPKTEIAPKADMTPKIAAPIGAKPDASAQTPPTMANTPAAKGHQADQHKNAKTPAAAANASATPAPTVAATATPAAKVAATPAPTASVAAASATPPPTASVTPAASVAPSVGMASEQNAKINPAAIGTPKPNTAAVTKRPDQQKVQQIRSEHASFRAEARPDRVPAVTFNQSYRVEGSDRWQGRQYEAFRSYRPERHDESFYRSRYSRVELIGGGYYYQNNGYWYPAWGYSPQHEYYAYDGPIYVGHRSEPPDRVIADVQATLLQMGYYKGEVDGLLGPLTRKALIGYQEDAGLQATAAIDEPTLDSLNMSS